MRSRHATAMADMELPLIIVVHVYIAHAVQFLTWCLVVMWPSCWCGCIVMFVFYAHCVLNNRKLIIIVSCACFFFVSVWECLTWLWFVRFCVLVCRSILKAFANWRTHDDGHWQLRIGQHDRPFAGFYYIVPCSQEGSASCPHHKGSNKIDKCSFLVLGRWKGSDVWWNNMACFLNVCSTRFEWRTKLGILGGRANTHTQIQRALFAYSNPPVNQTDDKYSICKCD